MKTRARILISNYGQDIIVKKSENDESIYTQAFIQPLRCDQQSELYGDYDKKNAFDVEKYLNHNLTFSKDTEFEMFRIDVTEDEIRQIEIIN